MQQRILQTPVSPGTITVTAGAYSTGQCIGGKLTFSKMFDTNVPNGEVRGVVLMDEAMQGKDIDLVLFHTNPSNTTFTDNAALDIADADLSKISAVIKLDTHVAFADNGISQAKNIAQPIHSAGVTETTNRTMYGVLVARDTITYAATTDVALIVYVVQN